MWSLYKKTFIPTQILVVIVLVTLRLGWHAETKVLATFAFMMEVSAVFGARAAYRLTRQGQIERQSRLPLERR